MSVTRNGTALHAVWERFEDRVHRRTVSRNVNELHDERSSVGDRMSDRLADIAGSWLFLGLLLGALLVWVVVNGTLLGGRAFDPYPFILLNLLLSLLAGVQAPVIMMSQNRQETRDRLRAENDYAVNLKAEVEIAQLHSKLDLLREAQWTDLLALQREQLELLERLLVQRWAGQTASGATHQHVPGAAERIRLPRRQGRAALAEQDRVPT
jgi:uncharacterized membrane protein